MNSNKLHIKPGAALILCLIFMAVCPPSLPAQDTGIVVNKLSAPDGPGGARITVTEQGDAASIIRMASSARRTAKINGYRVRIFFDNKQNARNDAYSALNRFKDLYPGIPADLKYDIPDFKVTVGNCLTNEEAIILWGRVKNSFPKAFIIPEEIPLDAFTVFTPESDATQTDESSDN